MRLRRRAGDCGGDPGDAALLSAVGLGPFSLLALPDPPPEEVRLAAAYDDASGRILVSLAGGAAAVSASPADLAQALNLPPRPVGLAEELDASVFSSPEAIAAVRGFVRDRVILGSGGDGGEASGEVAAALRLVEEGKAYEVDWGRLVWAVVKGEVVSGTPRRYAPYLLHLMERQIPEHFAELDGSLSPPKRWKGQEQQCQMDAAVFLALEEEEEETSLFGGSQNIGDFEDMPIFGKGNNVAFVGEEIHAQSEGDGGLGPLGTTSYLAQLQQVGGICNYQTPSPFQSCLGQIQGYVPAMEVGYLDMEKSCRDTQDEVERIKKMVMEKDHVMLATKSDILEELRVWAAQMHSFEADRDLMCCMVQQNKELLEKSLAAFQEYRNRIMRGEGADSYSGVLGTSGGQNQSLVQQMEHDLCKNISRIDQILSLGSLTLLAKFKEVETGMVKLSHEVQRINDSRSIPDLNNGVEDNGEDETCLSKEDRSCAREGCHVSNTTQAGKQLVELVANPDQRDDSRESMDVDGIQR